VGTRIVGNLLRQLQGGTASPFGCQQNPWAGYQIGDIIGLRAPVFGYPNRFYQPSFMSRPGISPSLESLGKEVNELSKRMEGILDRIENLGIKLKRGENR
jgi:hypothetical protein